VEELGRHDVELHLCQTFARAGALAEAERQDEARLPGPGGVALAVDPPLGDELGRAGEIFVLRPML